MVKCGKLNGKFCIKAEYTESLSDFVNNTIFGGIGGVIAGEISYKFFGAGGSDLAERLATSINKSKQYLRNLATGNKAVTNKEILSFLKDYFRDDLKIDAKMSLKDIAKMVVDNPMPLLSKSFNKEIRNLIIRNGIRESTISGIGGTDLSNYYQETGLGKFNNYWCNNNELAGFVHGESKEDKSIDDFVYVLNSKISEIGNEISSRLEKDIPTVRWRLVR